MLQDLKKREALFVNMLLLKRSMFMKNTSLHFIKYNQKRILSKTLKFEKTIDPNSPLELHMK